MQNLIFRQISIRITSGLTMNFNSIYRNRYGISLLKLIEHILTVLLFFNITLSYRLTYTYIFCIYRIRHSLYPCETKYYRGKTCFATANCTRMARFHNGILQDHSIIDFAKTRARFRIWSDSAFPAWIWFLQRSYNTWSLKHSHECDFQESHVEAWSW